MPFLHHLTYEEAEKYLSENDLVLLPIGSVEQHGPANPLGTDLLIAERLAREASSRTGVLTLPPIPVGVSFHHMRFPGTLTVSERSLEVYTLDVIASLARWGVRKVLIINGHGGNLPTLQIVSRRAREELDVRVFVYQWWTSNRELIEEIFSDEELGHAASVETSLNMHLHPDLVREGRLTDEKPKGSLPKGVQGFTYTHEESESGVFGIQTLASPEKGAKLFEALLGDLIRIIGEIRELP